MSIESYNSKPRTTADLFNLEGKIALVTGACGNGYGRQNSDALLENGAHVIITSRNKEKLNKRIGELKEQGYSVEGFILDLNKIDCINDFTGNLLKKHKKIDILINNAASNNLSKVEDISIKDWNQVIQVNLTANMIISRNLAPSMLRVGKGVIINMSSIYGHLSPDHSIYGRSGLNSPLIYAVTKSSIIQMTRYLATYWAPKIRVNCISPGGLYAGQDEDFVKNYENRTPLGKMAGPDDLKGVIAFLSSDASKWVTGQNVLIDGGWSIW